MTYIPPNSDEIQFNLYSYTPPAAGSIEFELGAVLPAEGSGIASLLLDAEAQGRIITAGSGVSSLTLTAEGAGKRLARGEGLAAIAINAEAEGEAPLVIPSGSGEAKITLFTNAVGVGADFTFIGGGFGGASRLERYKPKKKKSVAKKKKKKEHDLEISQGVKPSSVFEEDEIILLTWLLSDEISILQDSM